MLCSSEAYAYDLSRPSSRNPQTLRILIFSHEALADFDGYYRDVAVSHIT